MNKCEPKKLLQQNKLKITNQRVLLLETIINSEQVFSAISLQDKVENKMDLVTIYRILALFLEHNIIREVMSNDTTRYYELSCVHNPVHPHFICRKCNTIICLDKIKDEYIPIIKDYAGENTVENITIQFTGICSKCK